jgi:hypothetical protein
VIVACAVLHNFCIQQNEPEPEKTEEIENAVESTMEAAENENTRIISQTSNEHRLAVFKREPLMSQISGT